MESTEAAQSDTTTVCLSASRVYRVLTTCVACLIVLHLLGQTAKIVLGYKMLKGLVPLFDLDSEANVPSWFSSALLGACALVLAQIGDSVRRQGGPPAVFERHWKGLAIVFALLSMDELCSVHEKLILPMRTLLHAGGLLYFTWVVPGLLFVGVLSAFYLRFLQHLDRELRLQFLWAAMLYLGGAVGMEMVDGWWSQHRGQDNMAYVLLVMVEESLEMMGAIVFLCDLIRHATGAARATENVIAQNSGHNLAHSTMASTFESIPHGTVEGTMTA